METRKNPPQLPFLTVLPLEGWVFFLVILPVAEGSRPRITPALWHSSLTVLTRRPSLKYRECPSEYEKQPSHI